MQFVLVFSQVSDAFENSLDFLGQYLRVVNFPSLNFRSERAAEKPWLRFGTLK